MTNHPSRRPPPDAQARHLLRRTFHAFRVGARLHSEEIARLLHSAGHEVSAGRLRELGREGRGSSITAEELYALISTWADEQRANDRD